MTNLDKHNLGMKNRGDYYERTKWNNLEKAFAELWQEENATNNSSHHGVGLMQALFSNRGHQHNVTASERFVAATMIQWLGSNCGFSFLRRALKEAGYTVIDSKTGYPATPPGNEKSPFRRKFAESEI